MKRIVIISLLIIAFIGIVYVYGPEQNARKARQIDTGNDPVAYLAQQENGIPDIWPGAEKEIIWFGGREKTSYALIYLHGFTASKQEVRPLPDLVADQLKANIFYTRFRGHARPSMALANIHWQDWQDDLREAIAIGRDIGDKLIIMASSAGAAVLIAKSTDEEIVSDIFAMIYLSPIFGIPQPGLGLVAGPWGSQIVSWLAGEEVSANPVNEQHRNWWTTSYPSSALVPLAVTVSMANQVRPEDIRIPALFIYSPDDKVVLPKITATVAGRWGAVSDSIIVTDSSDPGQHVIAGDIRSPATTKRLARQIVQWLRKL